jgi:amidase
MKKIVFQTASELAKLIKAGEISAIAVLQEFLIQIDKHNSEVNAFARIDEKGAMIRAKEADEALKNGENWGALHGVPITIKDTWETAGLKTTCGFKPLKNYVSKNDAPVVAKLRSAGAIILGKSNVPVLSFDVQTDNPLTGRTNNPYDVGKTCGGSTGGGAAAIAAGFSALELGGDLGGSLRIPAHFCGVYSLKPSDERVANDGHILPLPNRNGQTSKILTAGLIARSVADLRLCLSLIENNGGDKKSFENNESGNFRIAWTTNFAGIPVQPEISEAIKNMAQKLAQANFRSEEKLPKIDFEKAWQTWGEIAVADTCQSLPFWLKQLLKLGFWKSKNESPINFGMFRGASLKQKDYAKSIAAREKLTADMDSFFTDYDAWILPASATTAFSHCKTGTTIRVEAQEVSYSMATTGFTCPFNLTGNPVVTLPAAKTNDGLPIGIQIVGRCGEDYKLLAIAEQISALFLPVNQPPGF